MSEDYPAVPSTIPTTSMHMVSHVISVDPSAVKQVFRSVTPPLLFGGALTAMIKTNGEFQEINYSVIAFAALCIITSLF